MALITRNLTNGGTTTHYRFMYDDSLELTATNPTGIEPARTNQVIAACEGDFNLMSVPGSLLLLGIPSSSLTSRSNALAKARSWPIDIDVDTSSS